MNTGVHNAVAALLAEVVDGPRPDAAFILNPDDRESFATAFSGALAKAKRG